MNNEYLGEALMVTLMGLIIVFVILIIISIVPMLFAVVFKTKEVASETKTSEPTEVKAPQTVVEQPSEDYMDDKVLVAVITAAIAASMNTTTDGLVVRSLRRVNTWNKEAIQEQQNIF